MEVQMAVGVQEMALGKLEDQAELVDLEEVVVLGQGVDLEEKVDLEEEVVQEEVLDQEVVVVDLHLKGLLFVSPSFACTPCKDQ